MKKYLYIFVLLSSFSCTKMEDQTLSVNSPMPLLKADTNLYTGSLIRYYSNGDNKKFEEVYKKGDKNGNYRHWYKNGKLKVVGTYSKNHRIGLWKWYKENGDLEYAFNYKS